MRPRLPQFVQAFVDRHGRPRHYLRRPGFKLVALPGLPWSEEFMAAYNAALTGAKPLVIGANRSKPGTVNDVVARYLASGAFGTFAPSTQAMRRATLERFRVEHGDKRFTGMQPEHVTRILGHLRPFAQRNMLKTLRGLAAFAIADGLVEVDATASVKLAKAKDRGGFPTWPVEEIERYRAHHKLGTRPRLALELLYGTMAARSDAVRLGRQHVQGGVLSFRRKKTDTPVDIPILPELQAAIDAMPKADHLTFLVTEFGKPFTAAGFGGWFGDQCKLAAIPARLSAHGLRKAGATRFAEHGATDHEIMAWGGWTSIKEVQRYTKAANRKRLAQQAAKKLGTGTEVSNLGIRFDNQGKKP
jgi:integrase